MRKSYWNLVRLVIVMAMLVGILLALFSCKSTLTVDNSAVKSMDLNRYLGRWYELARIDHSRTPTLSKGTVGQIEKEAYRRGCNTENLIRVNHK